MAIVSRADDASKAASAFVEQLGLQAAVIEPTGYETQLIVRFGGTDVTCVFRERVTARPGEAIHLSIDADHVHLFDAETGIRLID